MPLRWFSPALVIAAGALLVACGAGAPPHRAQAAAPHPEVQDRLDARARHQSEYGRTR